MDWIKTKYLDVTFKRYLPFPTWPELGPGCWKVCEKRPKTLPWGERNRISIFVEGPDDDKERYVSTISNVF